MNTFMPVVFMIGVGTLAYAAGNLFRESVPWQIAALLGAMSMAAGIILFTADVLYELGWRL